LSKKEEDDKETFGSDNDQKTKYEQMKERLCFSSSSSFLFLDR